MEGASIAAPIGDAGEKGLKKNAIGYLSNVVIGVASTAPGYSIAATLGFVVAVEGVGLQAPAVMMLAFVPMFCVAYAYKYMNQADPDCGTSFTWVTKGLGPGTGWVAGWAIVVTDVIVMASLAQIAAIYSFLLFRWDAAAESQIAVIIAGVVWIAVMTAICYLERVEPRRRHVQRAGRVGRVDLDERDDREQREREDLDAEQPALGGGRELGAEVCQDLSAALTVVFGWNVMPEREVADLRQAIHEIGERETAAAVARAQDAGVTAEARVETERAAEAIVRIAGEKDARMVVVGSHGERPIRGALVGSTPHRLVHLSDTPVLVVRG